MKHWIFSIMVAMTVILPAIGHAQQYGNPVDPIYGWTSPLNPASPMSINNNRHDGDEHAVTPAPKPLTAAEKAQVVKQQRENDRWFRFMIIFFPALIICSAVYIAIQQKRGLC